MRLPRITHLRPWLSLRNHRLLLHHTSGLKQFQRRVNLQTLCPECFDSHRVILPHSQSIWFGHHSSIIRSSAIWSASQKPRGPLRGFCGRWCHIIVGWERSCPAFRELRSTRAAVAVYVPPTATRFEDRRVWDIGSFSGGGRKVPSSFSYNIMQYFYAVRMKTVLAVTME